MTTVALAAFACLLAWLCLRTHQAMQGSAGIARVLKETKCYRSAIEALK